MAKHCNVCNLAYSDELPACPHCAARSGVDLEPVPSSPGSGSDSGKRGRAQDSDTWEPSVDPSGSSASGTHGSEVDLGARTPRIKGAPPPDLHLMEAAMEGGASAVDLGSTPTTPNESAVPSSPSVTYGETSAVDLGGPARKRGPAGSGLQLADLGAEPVEPSSDKLREFPIAADSGSDQDLAAFMEDGSHVDLGSPHTPLSDRPSGRDLIAEAVESGTDLLGTGPASSGLVAGQNAPFAGTRRTEDVEEDATVDLGAPHHHENAAGMSQISKKRWDDPSSGSMVRLDAGGDAGTEVSGDALDLDANAPTVPDLALGEDEEAISARRAAHRAVESEEPSAIVTPASNRGWLGGGVVGALVGGVAVFAILWLTGLVQFSKEAPRPIQPISPPAGNAVADMRPQPTIPAPAGGPIEAGKHHLHAYLASRPPQERGLDRNNADVKQAMDAFSQANNAEGSYWLGLLDELAMNEAEARAKYEKGLKDYQNDPRQARIFQAALHRLDARPAQSGNKAARVGFPSDDFPEPVAVLLLITLEADASPADADEAGFKFWEAAAKAKAGDYTTALDSLRDARQLHEKRRLQSNSFTGINPTSDPLEEIFVRCCEQLEAYWQTQRSLKQYGYDNVDTLAEARQQEGKSLDTLGGKLKIAAKRPATRSHNDLAKLDNWLTLVGTEVDGAIKARQASDDAVKKLAAVSAKIETPAVRAVLGDAKAATPDAVLDALVAKLTAVSEQLKTAGSTDADPSKALAKMIADTTALNERNEAVAAKLGAAKLPGIDAAKDPAAAIEKLSTAYQAVMSKLAAAKIKDLPDPAKDPAGAVAELIATVHAVGEKLKLSGAPNRTGLLQALDGVVSVAQSKDAGGQIRTLQARLQQYQNEWRSPKAMVDLWLRLARDGKLDAWLPSADADRRLLLDQMAKDAEHVADAADSNPEEQAKALCVQGLVRSQQGDYAGARQALKASLKDKPATGWRTVAAQSLKDLTDVDAYCLPWAETLYQTGQYDAALKHLTQGLAAFPNNGALLALRSLAAQDLADKLPPGDARAAEYRKQAADAAQAAIAAGTVADGHYAAGRLAESQRHWADAERHYRQALGANVATAEGSRTITTYRKALARVLLAQGGTPARPPAAVSSDRRNLAVVLLDTLTLLQADANGAQDAGKLKDARMLAEQVIKDGDAEGYLLLAQALRGENLLTQALTAYAEGLVRLSRDGGLGLRPEYARTLQEIVREHPAFQRPTTLAHAEPLQAEERFAAGLRFYNEGRYADAEAAFAEAYQFDSKDARFLYFLGLSRAPQGKWSAALEDFRLGADLERQGRPSAAAINASLERVQGNARQTVNRYRP
jgi:hypothetical protein